MVTQREWLADQGLAKPGARGRFSAAAHAALEEAIANGMVFDDPKPAKPAVKRETPKVDKNTVVKPATPTPNDLPRPKPKPQEKVRDIGTQLIGYTPEGARVGWATCSRCSHHANYCRCNGGPVAPSIVNTLPEGSPATLDKRWL